MPNLPEYFSRSTKVATRREETPRKHSKRFYILARAGITVAAIGVFCLLRLDVARVVWHRTEAYLVKVIQLQRSPALIEEYMKRNSPRKLQIGAGAFNKPGWLNTDIEPA